MYWTNWLCFEQAGVSPLMQHQFEELSKQKLDDVRSFRESKRRKLLVIGQECMEPLQALRSAGQEVRLEYRCQNGGHFLLHKISLHFSMWFMQLSVAWSGVIFWKPRSHGFMYLNICVTQVQMDVKETAEKRRSLESLRRKRKDEKKRIHITC